MKTPRRDFAVEYKTSRRPAKAQSKSIWGNLDLRAVANAVEADGALPPNDGKQAAGCVGAPPDAMLAMGVQVNSKAPAEVVSTSHSTSGTPVEPVAIENVEIQCGDALSSSQDAGRLDPAMNAMPKRPRRQAARPERQLAVEERHIGTEADGSKEELASLQEQNCLLKRLLVEKLRAENAFLTLRLRRFDKS